MGIKEFLHNMKERMANREVESYADDETRDRYLRSLRRERRIQMEQEEKKMLIAKINAYKKRQREEHLWGTKGETLLRKKNTLLRRQNKRRWL